KSAVRSVEKRYVGLDGGTGKRRPIDGETMVHRCDFDLPGGEILHRMIGPVVTLVHLDRSRPHRDPEHLVAETDPEGRNVAIDDVPDDGHRIFSSCGWIARTVGEKYSIGLESDDVLYRGRGGHDRDPAAIGGEQSQNVALDPVVDRNDMEIEISLAAI